MLLRWTATVSRHARPRVALPLLAALACICARPAEAAAPIRYQCELRERTTREPRRLEFTVDVNSGDAFVVENNGLAKVIAHVGECGVTFLEPLPTGAVQTTTIAKAGAALHSRHSILPNDEFMPAQYEGFCAVE